MPREEGRGGALESSSREHCVRGRSQKVEKLKLAEKLAIDSDYLHSIILPMRLLMHSTTLTTTGYCGIFRS